MLVMSTTSICTGLHSLQSTFSYIITFDPPKALPGCFTYVHFNFKKVFLPSVYDGMSKLINWHNSFCMDPNLIFMQD